MIAFWAIMGVFQIVLTIKAPDEGAGLATAVIAALLYVGVSGWYLYAKENVVEYYKVLESEQESGPAPSA
jgi:dTDP-glucose pyrophosphorylase